MVNGIDQFKAHFAGFADRYVLIGGAACYLAMEAAGLEFRVTKDLDVVDDQYRHETDNPTIGLILCQDKKRVLAEYALRGMNKPIGISEYELTRALPEELKSALPTIEEIEAELSAGLHDDNEGEV